MNLARILKYVGYILVIFAVGFNLRLVLAILGMILIWYGIEYSEGGI